MKLQRLHALLRPSLGGAVLFAGAVIAHGCGGSAPSANAPQGGNVSASSWSSANTALSEECLQPTRACIHAFENRMKVVRDLELLALVRDQRTLPAAQKAIATSDADIEHAGLQLLGTLSCPEHASDMALPLVLSPHPAVRELALKIAGCDRDRRRLEDQYKKGHPKIGALYAPRARDWPPDEAWLGFPKLPDAARHFSVGDSPTAVAFLVEGTPADVAKDLATRSHGHEAPPFEVVRAVTAHASNDFQSKMQSVQDAAAKIQAQMQSGAISPEDGSKKLAEIFSQLKGADTEATVHTLTPPVPDEGQLMDDAKGVVISEENGATTRGAVVYREPFFDSTVVMYLWDGQSVRPIDRMPRPLSRL